MSNPPPDPQDEPQATDPTPSPSQMPPFTAGENALSEQEEAPEQETVPSAGSSAGLVAAGIFSSRIIGLIREQVVAAFFGTSAFSDVFTVAFRGPNLLQNLLGEGTISASFVPIYSRMLEEGRHEEAGRFAGAIFGLLLATASALVLLGMLLAPYIIAIMAAGFLVDATGDLPPLIGTLADWFGSGGAEATGGINRYDLSVKALRIIFPMTGVLVLSAWALGVLNSHRRFFLPYFAPVLWNVAIIGALYFVATTTFGGPFSMPEAVSDGTLTSLLFAAFWGALVGGVLQFLVQVPLVWKLTKGIRVSFSRKVTGVKEAIAAFGPVVAGRGVYQLSGYLDMLLGSWLAAGALSSLRYSLMLYMLPVSLFGLSVAASELPELSRISRAQLSSFLDRLTRSMRQSLFLTVPTMVGYLAFGFLIVGALFQRGEFNLPDTWLVYAVLSGYAFGLLATTVGRLLQNAFYALNDTKTPAKIAVVRVMVSGVAAIPLMLLLDQFGVSDTLGLPPPEDDPLFFGAVGLALGSALGAYVELWRLLRALRSDLPDFHVPWGRIFAFIGMALVAAVMAGGVWWLLPTVGLIWEALAVLAVYGITYLGLAYWRHAPELDAWLGRFLKR